MLMYYSDNSYTSDHKFPCWEFFPHQLGVLQFSSILTVYAQVTSDPTRLYPFPPNFRGQSQVPGCHLCF